MNTIDNVLFYTHIIAGTISLILFWVPIFSRKGSSTHRRVGRFYVKTMWLVVATAALLSAHNFASGHTDQALFLGFLALLTANPLWHGSAALTQKREVSLSYRKMSLLYDFTLGIAGLTLIVFAIGVEHQTFKILMYIFGALGVLSLPKAIAAWRTPVTKINWLGEHIDGMLTTGIAAYTAFFAFGGSRLLQQLVSETWMILPWVTPAIIGTIGIRWSLQKYAIRSPIRSDEGH